ncbi:MAG: AMP-binding protein [Gemmatimonadaceae bacterium]
MATRMIANVVQLFLEAAERNQRTLAFVSATGDRVRFGELRRHVESFAGGLVANGLQHGDRAVFILPMSPALYVAVVGTLAAGGVAVFVDPWVSLRQIAHLAAAAKPAAFIGTPQAHLLRLFSRDLRRVRVAVTAEGPGAWLAARFRFRDLQGTAPIASMPGGSPALITYTTGSSGMPKGVNRTHEILAAQHHVIREEFPAQPGDVDLTTFPVFALSNLAAGITTVIPPIDLRRVGSADARLVVRDMRRFGVTTAAASPPLFDLVADHVRATGETPPPLRRIVTGGAPVRDDQLRRWRETYPGTEIVVAYGSSEAEPVASMSADERLAASATRPGYCVGKPVDAIRARTVQIVRGPLERPLDVAPGAIGELLVTGPHVCRDYAGDDAAFAENKVRDADGTVWHRMGDTGHFDDGGRFWLAGRVHSTIRRGGVDLHAQLIEQTVRGDDRRIRRVAALGRPDARLGERLAIVIEADDPGLLSDVEARLAAARADVVVDEMVVTRTALPVDPRHNSKIDYARLRRMLDHGALR